MLAKPAILRRSGRLELPPARRLILPTRAVMPGISGVRATKNVIAKTLSFGPGTYSFVWPEFNKIVFDFQAAGGGGGGALTSDGEGHLYTGGDGNGGGSSYLDLNGVTLIAYGGNGGGANNGSGGTQGAHGSGGNGDSNIYAGGAAGGAGGYPQFYQGGAGGYGGRVIRTILDGSTAAKLLNQTSTLVVGTGGAGGPNGAAWITGYASPGGNGSATITIT